MAHQPILYTIGMRGVHDGAMNGAKTLDEQRQVLERVFKDQRQLLAQYVNSDVTKFRKCLFLIKRCWMFID